MKSTAVSGCSCKGQWARAVQEAPGALAASVMACVLSASVTPVPELSLQTLSFGEHTQKSSHTLSGEKVSI